MTENHKRYAVVVGVSEYEDDISSLPFAKNDAVRISSILSQIASFGEDRVYLLANGTESSSSIHAIQPTRANILQKLKYICDAAGTDDLILFYFAGHGAEVSKSPYLLSCDTKMDVLNRTALNVEEINEMLESTKAQCIVKIFDACRSPFAEARGCLGRMAEGFEKAVLKCAKGWASFSSCSSGEIAHEWGELSQGVFSYYICEGLSGKACNNERNVTMEGLVEYVKTSVSNWCDRQTQKQTPHFQSDLSGTLVLAALSQPFVKNEIVSNSPFSELITGLEDYLGNTGTDIRRLTCTSEEENNLVVGMLHDSISTKLDELSHPAIKTKVSAPDRKLHYKDVELSQILAGEIESYGIRQQLRNITTIVVDFVSAEVIVPETKLYVTLARLDYLYWIWYGHFCRGLMIQRGFKPDPPYTKGFFTLKPTAAHEKLKVDQILRELFVRSSRDFVIWAKQLREYIESQVNDLRKSGPMIE